MAMETLTEGSFVAIIVGLVLGVFKLLEKIWPGKSTPFLQCPNKIEGLADTMDDVKASLHKIEDCSVATKNSVNHLLGQHAPEGGVEQWKIPNKMVPLLEAAVRQGERTLEAIERQHNETKKQNTDMIRVLERIADRRNDSR